MLRMDQVHVIRHKVLVEGVSIRETARSMKVSRNTVRKYLQISEPRRHERTVRRRPVLDVVAPRIETLLKEWKPRTTRKQRITGSRVHRQLIEEGYRVGITTVREYLRERKRRSLEVYVPLVWHPGECAQVDYFEVTVEIAGVLSKAWKFLMRLMYSGRDFVWLYEHCDQLSFLDGHVRAFAYFEGVPARTVYDNLTIVVKKKIGAERDLAHRFLALSSHYLFEPCFTRPGEGHDKGGVESRGKGVRLQHMTPIPVGCSLHDVSRQVLQEVGTADGRRYNREGKSVTERFREERAFLRPLPAEAYEVREAVLTDAGKQALVRVHGADYSVPSHWARLPVTAYVGVTDVILRCMGEQIRVEKVGKGKRKVQYRHYLGELARKPQAVRQVSAELLQELGYPYDRLWGLLMESHGERDAARVMAKVLGAIHDHGEKAVSRALQDALEHGRIDLLGLQAAIRGDKKALRIAVPETLDQYHVESGCLRDYDELLGGPR